jgi:hypothetical protein
VRLLTLSTTVTCSVRTSRDRGATTGGTRQRVVRQRRQPVYLAERDRLPNIAARQVDHLRRRAHRERGQHGQHYRQQDHGHHHLDEGETRTRPHHSLFLHGLVILTCPARLAVIRRWFAAVVTMSTCMPPAARPPRKISSVSAHVNGSPPDLR